MSGPMHHIFDGESLLSFGEGTLGASEEYLFLEYLESSGKDVPGMTLRHLRGSLRVSPTLRNSQEPFK